MPERKHSDESEVKSDVSITEKGPQPASAEATVGVAVRWTNDTKSEQKVVFEHGGPSGAVPPPDSEAIKPGECHDYTFTVPGDYKYTVNGKKGHIVVTA